MSGKNSADIRLVVDALDLCYTNPHIDSFVIISGDSDFAPLVSKLRENNKTVIGFGVKNSTSELLTANCHEFIYYDDLIRETDTQRKDQHKRSAGRGKDKPKHDSAEALKQEALDLVTEVIDDLFKERDQQETVWGPMIKQTMKSHK